MAKVEWSAGIDSVSGALAKPSKSGQHSCTKMLLGTHRVAPTTSNKCNRLYLRKPIKINVSQTEDSINARLRFAAVSAAVKARRKDLSHMAQDLQAFNAQKDQPNGCKTMTKYLWKVCGEAYDQAHNG
jgi:hypothetical protein